MSLFVDIKKRLGEFVLDVSFNADDPSETLAILGASGCGKSMTLKCIAGIERPDRGRIVLNDRVLFDSEARVDVPVQDRRVGYLFQNYALFPTMTVLDNVMAGVRGGSRNERRERALEQIRAFRLEGLEGLRPAELSGGQQQRCALARIMANDPDLLLLDEPFSALDSYLRWQLELELGDTLRAFPGGVVFVTHSRDEAYRMSQRVCVLDHGKSGRTVPTRELFDTPATLAEALISGCKNVSAALPVGETSLVCTDWGVTLDCARPVEGCDHVGLRAHFLRVVEADGRAVDTLGDAPTGFGSEAVPNRGELDKTVNLIPCEVARVIDNVFSTIVMCSTPGGGMLRVELEKAAWASLENPSRVTLEVAPSDVMCLEA